MNIHNLIKPIILETLKHLSTGKNIKWKILQTNLKNDKLVSVEYKATMIEGNLLESQSFFQNTIYTQTNDTIYDLVVNIYTELRPIYLEWSKNIKKCAE